MTNIERRYRIVAIAAATIMLLTSCHKDDINTYPHGFSTLRPQTPNKGEIQLAATNISESCTNTSQPTTYPISTALEEKIAIASKALNIDPSLIKRAFDIETTMMPRALPWQLYLAIFQAICPVLGSEKAWSTIQNFATEVARHLYTNGFDGLSVADAARLEAPKYNIPIESALTASLAIQQPLTTNRLRIFPEQLPNGMIEIRKGFIVSTIWAPHIERVLAYLSTKGYEYERDFTVISFRSASHQLNSRTKKENGCGDPLSTSDIYDRPGPSCSTPVARVGRSNHGSGLAFDLVDPSGKLLRRDNPIVIALDTAIRDGFLDADIEGVASEAWHFQARVQILQR